MSKMEMPAPPSVHDIRSRIAELKRIDLHNAGIEFLKSRLELLFRGFMLSTPFLTVGQALYRGVRWAEKPTSRSQLSYPPAGLITYHQRVNRPQQPMFYCSVAREAPFFELGLKPGDQVAISRWRLTQKILVNNVGYAPTVLTRLGSTRQAPNWGPTHPMISSPANVLVADFFASEFARVVTPGEEHLYKLSIAIAEKLYLDPLHMDSIGDEFQGERRFGGILYPTIAMRANSDNIALLPEFVDRFLHLEAVEWIRVDAEDLDLKYQVTNLDFANSFSSEERLDWKGRLAQWVVGPGREVRVSVENGKYVVRDEKENIVEPS